MPQDILVLGPFIAAVVVALAVLLVDLVIPGRRNPVVLVSLVGLAIVAALTITTGSAVAGGDGTARVTAFGGAYVVDGLTTFLDLIFIGIVALTIVFAPDYLEARGLPMAEFSMVLLFAMTGAMLIAASADLLVLFVALELMVLPGYMLAGYHKTDGYSTEGAIKYFLLGSFSSAIFLFGLAFTWGATGTTSIAGVSAALQAITTGGAAISPALVLGLGFLTTGVAFKIAAVPFHYWTPDAYQGSPTPVTGYLSVGPKVGAFALILRLFVDALGPLRADWLQVVIILAVLTMTLGNLVALTQNNV
jgi:NADH-quinone oxidoreductase subunit N